MKQLIISARISDLRAENNHICENLLKQFGKAFEE